MAQYPSQRECTSDAAAANTALALASRVCWYLQRVRKEPIGEA